VNTHTGQRSRDLPTEADDDLSDRDFGSIGAQQRLRSESNVDPLINPGNVMRQSDNSTAGFGLHRRTGTPEPWVRRLADDGMSYYYWNKLDGSVRWTMPESAGSGNVNGHGRSIQHLGATPTYQEQSGILDLETPLARLRSDSTLSNAQQDHSDSAARRTSVYSDDSEVDPIDRSLADISSKRQLPSAPSGPRFIDSRQAVVQSQGVHHTDAVNLGDDMQLTAAEEVARVLQETLEPPSPDSISDLSATARQAVAFVIECMQIHGFPDYPEQQNELELRILDSVIAIRNLLCVSSPPYGHISSSLYPKDGLDSKGISFAHSVQAQLKPAQRKVTATLSKLVLAALAAQYDTNAPSPGASTRMEADAVELDRALVIFSSEVERALSQDLAALSRSRNRRLRAAFSPRNLGPGLPGAGAAGGWKGFGWVPLPDREALAERVLGAEVIADLKRSLSQFDEKLVIFHSCLVENSASGNVYLHLLIPLSRFSTIYS
jgi:son of sevenless